MNISQPKITRPKKLNALTSLRFFAAATIVLHHAKDSFGFKSQWLMGLPTGQPVSFFFVLSGFILAYIYPSLKNMKEVGRFILARVARIWPLHVATLCLVFILLPANLRSPGGQDTLTLILSNLFMVHAWIPIWNYFFSYNHLSWAVSTEFAFYLLFPLLLYRWQRTWHVKLLGTFLMVASIIWFAGVTKMPQGIDAGTTAHVGYIGLVYISPLGRLFEFTLGMCLALIYPRMNKAFKYGKLAGTLTEAVVLALAVGEMAMSLPIGGWIMFHCPWLGGCGLNWLMSAGIPCGFYGLLILCMAMEKGLISHLLSWRFLTGLGEMSLAIFLLHQTLIRYYRLRIENTTNIPDSLFFLYFVAVLLLGAYLLMAVIEHPCRQFILEIGRPDPFMFRNRLKSLLSLGKLRNTFGIFFNDLFVFKKHVLIAGGSLFILLMIIPICLPFAAALKNEINPAQVRTIIKNWNPEYQQIRFGDKFILWGANLSERQDKIVLQLIWESVNQQKLKYSVAVHILDPHEKILTGADYSQSRGDIQVAAHTFWLDETEISENKLIGASTIGIGIYDPHTQKLLQLDCDGRQVNNQRLLIRLPSIN